MIFIDKEFNMNKENIRKILRESIEIPTPISEEETTTTDAPKKEKKVKDDTQYDRLQRLLDNNIFNHAGIIEKLWGSSDATNRSLFGKKLNMDKNDDGGTYQFSEEEVSKILQILQNTSNDIKHTVGSKNN